MRVAALSIQVRKAKEDFNETVLSAKRRKAALVAELEVISDKLISIQVLFPFEWQTEAVRDKRCSFFCQLFCILSTPTAKPGG